MAPSLVGLPVGRLASAGLAIGLAAGGAPLAAQVTAIRFARVVSGGGAIPDATVLVEGDRIASVRAGQPPAGATVIDLRGLTGLPGLIDAHVTSPTTGTAPPAAAPGSSLAPGPRRRSWCWLGRTSARHWRPVSPRRAICTPPTGWGCTCATSSRSLMAFVARNVETVRRAHRAGVRIAMGSDAVFTGFGENTLELGWFVRAGMTPLADIQAVTRRVR